MLEDAIERSHQKRVRLEARLVRMRNKGMIKVAQAKYENTGLIPSVIAIQENVRVKNKRKINRDISLKSENEQPKKAKRDTERQEIVDLVNDQENIKVVRGRDKIKEGLKQLNNL